ncbi:hypothetical protein O181_029610 [Austropuccinia psidii MF-1]|uniref:Inhibitor I9 domain-containing protein n=1 Tax=Austropuccinia psidii MF-1 TaxID=1389203 RepID=A0A9Q3H5D0_9BASI|nr:hypothetical protein [Austropuccinia psidii MF-1]
MQSSPLGPFLGMNSICLVLAVLLLVHNAHPSASAELSSPESNKAASLTRRYVRTSSPSSTSRGGRRSRRRRRRKDRKERQEEEEQEAAEAESHEEPKQEEPKDNYIVTFHRNTTQEQLKKYKDDLESKGATVEERTDANNNKGFQVTTQPSKLEELRKDPQVQYILLTSKNQAKKK